MQSSPVNISDTSFCWSFLFLFRQTLTDLCSQPIVLQSWKAWPFLSARTERFPGGFLRVKGVCGTLGTVVGVPLERPKANAGRGRAAFQTRRAALQLVQCSRLCRKVWRGSARPRCLLGLAAKQGKKFQEREEFAYMQTMPGKCELGRRSRPWSISCLDEVHGNDCSNLCGARVGSELGGEDRRGIARKY